MRTAKIGPDLRLRPCICRKRNRSSVEQGQFAEFLSSHPTERVSYFDQPIHHYTIYCVAIACIAAGHASSILLEREGEREI